MINVAEIIGAEKVEFERAVCELHGEYQAYMIADDERSEMECPKCELAREQQAAEEKRQAVREQKRREARELSGVPERFRSRTLDNYRVTHGEKQQHIVEVCRRYANGIAERIKVGNSLIFCGSVGTGKTHLAAAIANHALDKGFDAVFTTAIKASRAVKNTYNKSSAKTEQQVINELAGVDLLVLDEIGVQLGTDTEKTILFEIINERYERCKPTIVISNFDPQGLERHLGERVVSRLRDGGVQLFFDWADYRKGGAA